MKNFMVTKLHHLSEAFLGFDEHFLHESLNKSIQNWD